MAIAKVKRTVKITICCLVLIVTACVTPGEQRAIDPSPLDLDSIRPRGEYYTVEAPDTLDLAERARLSINSLTGNVDPDRFYAVYQAFDFTPDQFKIHGLTWNLVCKNARALPKLRAMCGSDQNLEIERGIMARLLAQVNADGIVTYPFEQEGVPLGTSYPLVNAIVSLACENWYARDHNPAWLQTIEAIDKGLRTMAIQVEDRAYFPPECGYKADGTWHWNTREGSKPYFPYQPPEEPVIDQQGYEGSVKFEQSQTMRAMLLNYKYTGNPESLEMARKVGRFCMKPSLWEDTTDLGYEGVEHGVWAGHFHGNLTALYSLLDLALVAKDSALAEVVREGYDNARRNGAIRMGWLVGWTQPEKFKRAASLVNIEEPCAVGDMMLLAVKLSDAGLGDYWDDVDSCIRNHWAEQQLTDVDRIVEIVGDTPEHLAAAERFLGSFAPCAPNRLNTFTWACCSANAAIGMVYAWDGIIRFDNGVATVNLLLNRASKWMDVDSYLPYEGKVVLRNKLARTAMVRIPGWLGMDEVRAFVNDRPVDPAHVGRYLMFDRLKKNAEIRLEFPVHETKAQYTIDDVNYTVTYRGHTVVDIDPKDADERLRLYRRAHMRADKAPMRRVERFVSDELIPLPSFTR